MSNLRYSLFCLMYAKSYLFQVLFADFSIRYVRSQPGVDPGLIEGCSSQTQLTGVARSLISLSWPAIFLSYSSHEGRYLMSGHTLRLDFHLSRRLYVTLILGTGLPHAPTNTLLSQLQPPSANAPVAATAPSFRSMRPLPVPHLLPSCCA
jgi:hypothetical protein